MPENDIPSYSSEFGLTPQDIKNQKVKTFFGAIKFYLEAIWPTIIKILNSFFYYTLKFIKSFVTSIFQMIKGG